VLSAIIGVERERLDRPAGLRTHVLVGVGACLLMLLSVAVASEAYERADPGRIASQVVVGMGFLGAGTIIRHGNVVKGLTTAASLWTTSAIGLTVGFGWYVIALAVTGGVFATLTVVRVIEHRLLPRDGYAALMVSFRADDVDVGAMVATLSKLSVELSSIELGRATDEPERAAAVVVKPPRGMAGDVVAQELAKLDAVTRAEAL